MSLEDFRYDVEMCLRCSSCKWIDPMWAKSKRYNKICPISSHYHFDGYSCQGVMDIALGILEGELDYGRRLADIVYHCTLCGACDVMCKRTLETERLLVIEELRKQLAERGFHPGAGLNRLRRSLAKTHNAFGAAHRRRLDWMNGEHRDLRAGRAKTIYFVGCTASYKHGEIARATVELLRACGVEFTVLQGSEWCCGNPVLRAGWEADARVHLEHNLMALRDAGAEQVITACAECYHTWKVDYPRLRNEQDLGYRVLHVTEVLAEALKAGRLRFRTPLNKTVTYHDSCRLGRLGEAWEPWQGRRGAYGKLEPAKAFRRGSGGIYFQPRAVLNAIPGLRFVEMERVRENTFCCGAGGAVQWTFRDFALATGSERLAEAADSGAEILASACPFCKWNLEDAAKGNPRPLAIADITELAARAL